MPIKENGAANKLRINSSQKGDLILLAQEFQSAISQTMAQMSESEDLEFQEFRPTIERRLQEFSLDIFRNASETVEFTKNADKAVHKVTTGPDIN